MLMLGSLNPHFLQPSSIVTNMVFCLLKSTQPINLLFTHQQLLAPSFLPGGSSHFWWPLGSSQGNAEFLKFFFFPLEPSEHFECLLRCGHLILRVGVQHMRIAGKICTPWKKIYYFDLILFCSSPEVGWDIWSLSFHLTWMHAQAWIAANVRKEKEKKEFFILL